MNQNKIQDTMQDQRMPSEIVGQMDEATGRYYLQLLIKNIEESFIMIDKDYRIVLVNDPGVEFAKRILNIDIKIGMHILDLASPDRHEALVKIFESVLAGYNEQSETRFIKPDGTEVFLQNHFKPVRDESNDIRWIQITTHDATLKKRSDQHIQQSAAQYQLLFKNNPLPAWIYDLDTLQFLEVNNVACEFYGYTAEEFLQLKVSDIRPKEDVQAFLEDVQQNRMTPHTNKNIWRHLKKNGELIIVEVTAGTIIYNNRPARLIVINDVTEKINSEAALIESNERFMLASKASSEAIWEWDLEKNMMQWGEGLYKLFGYYGASLSMQDFEELVHPDNRTVMKQYLEDIINNPNENLCRYEYKLKHANGSYRIVEDQRFLVRDATKKVTRMIGALKDITGLKEKEKELLFLNERYDLVTKATHDLIWDWNLETGEVYRDPTNLYMVYGVADNEEINKIGVWITRIHPDDFEKVNKSVEDILQSRDQHTFEIEYRFLKDDGTYAYIFDRGYIIRDQANKPYRMIGAAQNISQRKLLEETLLQEELNRQKNISQAVIDTQEKERSDISKELHDNVNQVLTTTKLYLDLLNATSNSQPELINKSSQNIIYVINLIRHLSRSLSLSSLGDLGLIDSLKDLIEDINATNKLEVIFIEEGIDEASLEDNQKLMIYRITQEGLTNILKHSQATVATVHLMKDTKNLRLMIRDDGKGFDSDKVKPGSGLNNIRNRVYLFSGNLYLHTAPGKGCEMIIDIPLKK